MSIGPGALSGAMDALSEGHPSVTRMMDKDRPLGRRESYALLITPKGLRSPCPTLTIRGGSYATSGLGYRQVCVLWLRIGRVPA